MNFERFLRREVLNNLTSPLVWGLDEIDRLFAYLTKLGVDGFMLSPAYGYVAVQETNPTGAAEIFMTEDAQEGPKAFSEKRTPEFKGK